MVHTEIWIWHKYMLKWYLFTLFSYSFFHLFIFFVSFTVLRLFSPVRLGCRIVWLHLCTRGRTSLPTNKYPGYDTKPSDDEPSVLEFWEMWNISSLTLLLGPLWPRVVAPVRVPSLGQIKLFNHLSATKWLMLNFANSPVDLGSIPGRVIQKTQKIVLDTSLLNTQHHKVQIKGKVEQSRKRSRALPYTLV